MTNIKNFVVKYWQWIVMIITAIAFYLTWSFKGRKTTTSKILRKMERFGRRTARRARR